MSNCHREHWNTYLGKRVRACALGAMLTITWCVPSA
jgi:hypothetical protein